MSVPSWLSVRASAAFLAPTAVAAIAVLLLPDVLGAAVAAVGAAATAWLLAARAERRVGRLRGWLAGVRRGEHGTWPLPSRAPDALDALSGEMGAFAEEVRERTSRLTNERDRLEAVLGAMVEAVLVIDRQGIVVRANERVRAIFGLGPNDPLVDRPLVDVSRDTELGALVREAVSRGRPTSREVHLRSDRDRFLAVTAGPTADGSAYVLVLHDVTEMKRLERVRTDFVANVSHELRTPLTAIRGFAETLGQGAYRDPDVAARYASIIERQAARLSRLIDDLLVLSDLERGRMPVRRRPIRLAPVVEEAVQLLESVARRAEVRLAVACDESIEVMGDPDRLAQVVSNLLENAIKFSNGPGEVRLRAAPGAEGRTVELEVVDQGVGIPAEDLPRLAERFYRVDKARSSELGGTGLGLSIVKHIVQAHGGTLEIESRLGIGTKVTVRLPRAA